MDKSRRHRRYLQKTDPIFHQRRKENDENIESFLASQTNEKQHIRHSLSDIFRPFNNRHHPLSARVRPLFIDNLGHHIWSDVECDEQKLVPARGILFHNCRNNNRIQSVLTHNNVASSSVMRNLRRTRHKSASARQQREKALFRASKIPR